MKRESLITKLVAFMLCVMMVVGCLPVSAFATNDWEGEIDVADPIPGSEEAPILLNALENTVTVEAGETVYYYGHFNGMVMTVTGATGYEILVGEESTVDTEGVVTMDVVCASPRDPFTFAVVNKTEADVEYTIVFTYPEGSSENPYVATLYDNNVSVEAGDSDGYYMTYTADYTGTLLVTIRTEAVGWTYTINNMTTYVYGDTQWSDSDPVVNPAEIEVTQDDEIQIIVNTYDPAAEWNSPAGEINAYLEYKPGSCEAFPIFLGEMENNVTNAGTVYYGGYFSGTVMTVSGEGDFNVIYNGETIAAVDGVVSTAVSSPNPRMPVVFAIEGDGEYSVSFAYPAGSQNNPAVAVLGDNPAAIEAGNEQGYYWTYTAEKAGDLVFTFSSSDNNWTYVINNMTTGAYGDTQWNDSDPVVNPATITVAEGDVIQVIVNTYNPADMWSTPAGTVAFNLAYKVEEPAVAISMYKTTLSLSSNLTMNFTMLPEVYEAYENVYVVFTYAGETIEVHDAYKNAKGDRYVFDYAGISPNAMGYDIVAVAHGTYNGVEYVSEPYTDSIQSYLRRVLDAYKSYSDAQVGSTRVLIADLLAYGDAAQIYDKVDVDNLASSVLSEEEKAYATTAVPTVNNIQNKSYIETEGAVASVENASLVLGATIKVRFKLSLPTTENVVLHVEADGHEWDLDCSGLTATSGYYYIDLDELKATQMRSNIYATVYQNGVAISDVMLTSIESYAARAIPAFASQPALVDLLNAMIRYGDSCLNY